MDNNITANAPAPMDPEIQKAVLSQLLSSSDQDAILSLEIVRELYRKALEQKALEKYKFPQKPSSDGYYHCYIKDPLKKSGRRQIKAKTLEELIEVGKAITDLPPHRFRACPIRAHGSSSNHSS